ncbi:MAG TPA: hypothetical protein VJ182_06645 [Anaerolineales bacterium]|nr:hypothetical protein [Anaerolineales bacterium]
MYLWLVFLHVLSGFVFFLAHGASAAVLLKLRQERDIQRIKALFDLRSYAEPAMSWSAGVLFLSGIVAGFVGRWWGYGWIWASLILLILVSVMMTYMGRMYFERVRKAVGLDHKLKGSKPTPAEKPASAKVLEEVILAGKPGWVAAAGLVGLALIVWLMMFKPF